MKIINKIYLKIKEIYYICLISFSKGVKNVKCPFCGWEGKEFYPFGVNMRKNAKCP